MKERPILFSGPMVRALLDGSKTQTRRVAKPKLAEMLEWFGGKSVDDDDRTLDELLGQCTEENGLRVWCADYPEEGSEVIRSPYGQPGDQLWVRETWAGPLIQSVAWEEAEGISKFMYPEFCEYKADGGPTPEFLDQDENLVCRWTPGIHMPRWASRITLEITGVRLERLQDISEADSISEGIVRQGSGWRHYSSANAGECMRFPKNSYRSLWESINGPDSWDSNPWVWVVEFKVVKP